MGNQYFKFKQFTIQQEKAAMKVTTDSCLFGAWVAAQISKKARPNTTMLDIGTGTGLLSLMIAQQTSGKIEAIELDDQTYNQADENIITSPWADRIQLHHGDAVDFSYPHQYDYIFSNPPFYENELRSGDKKKDIAHHQDGLTLAELLALIEKNLKLSGSYFLLLPYKRHDEILKTLYNSSLSIQQMTLVRQSVNHGYFRILLEGNVKSDYNDKIQYNELAIRLDETTYTDEFTKLLREYYLHLK